MSLEELRFVNAFIGFCTPSGETWPAPLAGASYQVTGLEHEVHTVVNGVPCAPVPEMICSSTKVQHCVLLEAKSGSVSDRQARAYKAVTINQLVVEGLAADEIDVSGAHVDVIYMSNELNSRRLSTDFGRAGLTFPLIAHGDSAFRLVEGSILQEAMHETFLEGVIIDEDAWPMHFVRCDRDSSDGDLAAVCISKMVALLIRQGQLEVEQLASSTIDLWDRRGHEDQRRLRRRLTSLLVEAENCEFKREIIRDRPRQRWRRFGKKSFAPQAIDRLSDLAAQFVRRKQEGRPFNPDQPPLIPFDIDE